MHPILRKLEGGDRRSIGRSEQVVADVLCNPDLFGELVTGLSADNAILRMRAADEMGKISLKYPEYLRPHHGFLIEQAARSDQKEMRWHLAQMLPRLKLNDKEKRRVVDTLLTYFADSSSIVKTFAMQALADIARQTPKLRPLIRVVRDYSLWLEVGTCNVPGFIPYTDAARLTGTLSCAKSRLGGMGGKLDTT